MELAKATKSKRLQLWCFRRGEETHTILPHKSTISHINVHHNYASVMQRNHSIKDTLNKGHLSNEGTVCSPNHTQTCVQIYL